MKHKSSATLAVYGSSSLSHAPDCPCCANLKIDSRDRKARLPRGHRRQPLAVADRIGQVGAMHFCELRLVVEQIELRGSAALEQIDDALGLRREVRQARRGRPSRSRPRLRSARAGRPAAAPPGRPRRYRCQPARENAAGSHSADVERRAIHGYSFITVSFRLRIRLVTLVYAASSLTSSRVSRGYSPLLTYFRAASGFDLN